MGFALLFRTVGPAGFAWAAGACGNGIVEGGEECDPGGELHCDGSRGTNPPFVKGGLGSCAPANATLAMNVQTPDKRADKVVVASRTPLFLGRFSGRLRCSHVRPVTFVRQGKFASLCRRHSRPASHTLAKYVDVPGARRSIARVHFSLALRTSAEARRGRRLPSGLPFVLRAADTDRMHAGRGGPLRLRGRRRASDAASA